MPTVLFDQHILGSPQRSDAPRESVFLLTDHEVARDPALRAAAKNFIETEVKVLFAEEQSLLALLEVEDLGQASAWLAHACPMAVLVMGAEGAVVFSGGAQTFGAGARNFAVAPDRYAAGFMEALSRGEPLKDCAEAGARNAAAVVDQVQQLVRWR